jgi:hypothetical protein
MSAAGSGMAAAPCQDALSVGDQSLVAYSTQLKAWSGFVFLFISERLCFKSFSSRRLGYGLCITFDLRGLVGFTIVAMSMPTTYTTHLQCNRNVWDGRHCRLHRRCLWPLVWPSMISICRPCLIPHVSVQDHHMIYCSAPLLTGNWFGFMVCRLDGK